MDDLRRLLQASDRPRRLAPEEDARIRARLGLDDAIDVGEAGATHDAAAEDGDAAALSDIGIREPAEMDRRRARRSWPMLASAAALLLLVLAVGTRMGPSDEIITVDGPVAAQTPTREGSLFPTATVDVVRLELERTCTRALTPLTDDIAVWGGIELWGAVNVETAVPNLERSLLVALDAFGRFPLTAGAAEIADHFVAELEAASLDEIPARAKLARVDAVDSAARELAALLAAVEADGPCDLAQYEAALELGAR